MSGLRASPYEAKWADDDPNHDVTSYSGEEEDEEELEEEEEEDEEELEEREEDEEAESDGSATQGGSAASIPLSQHTYSNEGSYEEHSEEEEKEQEQQEEQEKSEEDDSPRNTCVSAAGGANPVFAFGVTSAPARAPPPSSTCFASLARDGTKVIRQTGDRDNTALTPAFSSLPPSSAHTTLSQAKPAAAASLQFVDFKRSLGQGVRRVRSASEEALDVKASLARYELVVPTDKYDHQIESALYGC